MYHFFYADFESILLTPNLLIEEGVLVLAEDSDSVVVEYSIAANPVDIQLTRNDGMEVDARLEVTDSMLIITGASRADAGMYNLSFSHPDNGTIFFNFTLEIECKWLASMHYLGTRCTHISH